MKSKIYFVPVKNSDSTAEVIAKLKVLLAESKLLDFICAKQKVALKMHFGEEGNTGFVKPEYAAVVCAAVAAKGAHAYLADTNTLYRGRRTNSKDHLQIAREHGFTKEATDADVVIPDDSLEENTIDIKINGKFIRTAKLTRFFVDADAIIGIAHFKGHIMTGFGGALKNLGMGCATRIGKLMQHSDVSPVIYKDNCTGCGACVKACPVGAIRIVNKKSVIDGLKCIGCATCIAVCPEMAIDVPWEQGGGTIQEKMVEYASAVLKGKNDKVGFLNFAIKITKECDCLAKDDPRICPDVGIFAGVDPVSIDKASFDQVNNVCGRDIFKELHPKRDAMKQLIYAQELGLGNLDYELIEIDG